MQNAKISWIDQVGLSKLDLNFLPLWKDGLVELKLKSLHLELNENPNWWVTAEKFDCRLLKDCNNLKTLRMDFGESNYSRQASRAKVKNIEFLPKSLQHLTFGGFITLQDVHKISTHLRKLRIFSCRGCENSVNRSNVLVLLALLNFSTATQIRFVHEKPGSKNVFTPLIGLSSLGVSVQLDELENGDDDCITLIIDREYLSRVKPWCITVWSRGNNASN